MKRLFTLMLASAAMLASCQKEEYTAGGRTGGEVDVRLAASLPKGFSTYASNEGGATNLPDANMRFILEVYGKDGSFVKREVQNAGTARTASFDLRLLAKEYDFVFWADFVADGTTTDDRYYNTESLKAVKIISGSYDGNNEARDAYTAVYAVDLRENGANVKNITLTRPFGKVRVMATDIPNHEQWTPTQVTVAYKDPIPAGYNALQKKVTEATMRGEYTASLEALEGNDGAKVLMWDYIFDDGKSHGFTLTSSDGTGNNTFPREIATVPVVKNKLTTLKGAVITHNATMSVNVSDAFDEEISQDIVDIALTADATPAEIASAIDQALKTATHVRVVNEVKATNDDAPTVTIPAEAAVNPQISLNFAGGVTTTAEKPLTIAAPEDYTGRIEVTTNNPDVSNAGAIVVNAPQATVVIDGKVKEAVVSSGENTTIVNKGSVVDKLTVAKGNVKVYGTVKEVVKNDGAGRVYLVIGEGTDRPVSGTVVKEALGWEYADGLILTGGKYPLNYNVQSSHPDGKNEIFFLPIEKAGFTIKSEEGQQAVLYGDQETANAAWGTQNLVTVLAEGVTLENLVLMPKKEINKIVETVAAGFTLRNCVITPNTIKGYDNNAGSVWIDGDNAVIEGNTLEYAGITVRENRSVAVTGNTFRYGSAHDNWTHACVSARGNATLSGNTFLNIAPAAEGNTPLEAKGNGVLNLGNNKFPGNGTYWVTADAGRIVVDGHALCGPAGLNAAIAAATAGETIYVSAGKYANGVVNVDKQVTIEGYGEKPLVSGARFDIKADGAILRNLTIDFDSTYTGSGQDHIVWVHSANVTVDGCTVTNSRRDGCSGHPASWSAVYLATGDGFTLSNSTIELISSKSHKSLYQGTGAGQGAGCLIKGNVFKRNISFDYPTKITIAGNDFDCGFSAVTMLGGKEITITGNNFNQGYDTSIDIRPWYSGNDAIDIKVNGNNFAGGKVSNTSGAGTIDASGNYWKYGPKTAGEVNTDSAVETPFSR